MTSKFKRIMTEEDFPGLDLPPEAARVDRLPPSEYPSLAAGDLLFARHRGSFLRPCPATPRYNCCGLNIVHIGQGCDINCAYCILSAYLGSDAVIGFGNAATEGLGELEAHLDLRRRELERGGTEGTEKNEAPGEEENSRDGGEDRDKHPDADRDKDKRDDKKPEENAGEADKPDARVEEAGDDGGGGEDEENGGKENDDARPGGQDQYFAPAPGYGLLKAATPRSFRYCTGEFTDSLLLEKYSGVSARLVELFSRQKPFVLELKTKTDNVSALLDLDHGGRTVVSFSVNAPSVCARLEPGAAGLTARLGAAERAWGRGYRTGLHFDPLVLFSGWEREYAETVALIKRRVDPESLAFVSLGCFRYLPELKPVMLRTRPSSLFDQEFVRGGDGKMRYPRPARRLMYRTLLGLLREAVGPRTVVYLCMESGRVWREVLGFDPGTEGLTGMFSRPD
ncbi:MAG: hypothetical protein LBP95_08490 [Deltaproteobacteria bacterium]|jgi:DNA repair photolyase|nr:hypothetical protein [Deltaproteobacteria bacterium]